MNAGNGTDTYSECGPRRRSRSASSQSSHTMKLAMGTHEVIAMVVSFLAPDAYLDFIVTCFASCFQEILGQELSLLVEVVSGALHKRLLNEPVSLVKPASRT